MTSSCKTAREHCRETTPWQQVAGAWLIALVLTPAIIFLPAIFAAPGSTEEAQPYPPLSRPLAIEQVPDKPIYYVVGNPGVPGKENEGHTSNAGFVVTSQGVVVFDALGTPSLGLEYCLQQIRKMTDQPIRYVVVSHYHADHIYGLRRLEDHSPAIIVAQERATNTGERGNRGRKGKSEARSTPGNSVSLG